MGVAIANLMLSVSRLNTHYKIKTFSKDIYKSKYTGGLQEEQTISIFIR